MNTPVLVRDLAVSSDYGQLYVGDYEGADSSPQTEEDNSLLRSLDDAQESRRFVGYDAGMLNILTPSQYWETPLRLEVFDCPPPPDARIQLWPAEESEPTLVKYWDG